MICCSRARREYVKSNAIVCVKTSTLGIGAGQIAASSAQDRCDEGKEKAVLDSVNGFGCVFPVPRRTGLAAESHQVGDSTRRLERDADVIAAATSTASHVFTGMRHFRH